MIFGNHEGYRWILLFDILILMDFSWLLSKWLSLVSTLYISSIISLELDIYP